MAEEADILIAWNHGAIPKSAESAFQRPTRFINLPNPESGENWSSVVQKHGANPIRSIIAKYAPGVTPLRVGLLGFSASCAGVAAVLKSADGGNVDVVYACDGIHVSYADKATKKMNVTGLQPWLDFGKLAVVNERLFVITHSSVVPPNYASTTETANWLWTTLTSSEDFDAQDPPVPSLVVPPTSVTTSVNGPQRTVQYPAPPWKRTNRDDGLIVLGCSNLDPSGTTDHIYQAKAIMPAVLAQVVAARWNSVDPKAPGQICFVGGPPAHPADIFTLGASCAKSMVLPASYMQSATPNPLPTGPVPQTSLPATASSSGMPTFAKLALGALAVGGLAWIYSRGYVEGLMEENPTSVDVMPTVARIRYRTADVAQRIQELRVYREGSWELRNYQDFPIAEGRVTGGQLEYVRGAALRQTVDKANRVFMASGIWTYTGPNEARWQQ